MDKYLEFKAQINNAAIRFNDLDAKKPIRIISHLDADGICAASIMINTINHKNMIYDLSIVPQLSSELIDDLSKEETEQYIFTDIGSGKLKEIIQKFSNKLVFILDHHSIDSEIPDIPSNIVHINPHRAGIDGGKEISGSGVVFLFARTIDSSADKISHLPIIGAIGDVQEDNGFVGLNKEILDIAVKNNKILIHRGLRFFGGQTRPLHKMLEYSSDPLIPGVSGSETGAMMFITNLGIPLKHGNDWTRLIHLAKEEQQKLASAIIMERVKAKIKDPENIFSEHYIIADEKTGTPTKDAREFSTMLNSCGRMNKASLGIGICLGDEDMKKKAAHHLEDYKKEIVYALNWFRNNKGSDQIIEGKNYVVINAKDDIMPTIIGTLASIISKSSGFKDDTLILSMARNPELAQIKISLRISGAEHGKNIDLRQTIQKIIETIGSGEAGGHQYAAGAVIPITEEDNFVKATIKILEELN